MIAMIVFQYEDEKWISGIGVYFLLLETINKNLHKFTTYKCVDVEEIKISFFNLVCNINRLIPMKYRKISYADGILRLSKYYDFLNDDFAKLYNNYSNALINMNDIRNKFEHAPHIIELTNYLGGRSSKKLRFINKEYTSDIIECNNKSIEKRKLKKEKVEWIVDTDEIINIIIDVNNVFIKIQNKLKNYLKNNKEALKAPYIKRMSSIDFIKYMNQLKNIKL